MKVAVVTGASGGIGSAIARRLADDGFSVVAGYNQSADSAKALVGELAGEAHQAMRIGVLEPDTLDALNETIAVQYGQLDVLVNCAGISKPIHHEDLDGLEDDLIDQIFATNWRGAFAAIRSLRPLLEKGTNPVVVNISSVAGVTGQGSNVAYCASKAALDSMTRSLGRALAPKIRVISVSPGWVMGEYAMRMPETLLNTQCEATPLGRLAQAEDVAAAVAAVVSDLLFTTGSIINVDGGRPLGTT